MHDEGFLLLSDPRWLSRQMKLTKWKQVDDDIVVIMRHFQDVEDRESMGNVITFLKMVRATLVESERYMIGSELPGMIYTQLYGRLWNYKQYKLVGRFLDDVERFASPDRWLKSEGAFPAPAPAAGKVLANIGKVVWLRDNAECPEFITFVRDGRVFKRMKYVSDDDALVVLDKWAVPYAVLDGNDCWSGALSLDGYVLTAGFGSAAIVFYQDLQAGVVNEQKHVILRCHADDIYSLSISRDGALIAAGSGEGNVICWQRHDNQWHARTLKAHYRGVECVDVTKCGTQIASGSCDNTVGVHTWDEVGKDWQRVSLHGHTRAVNCVTLDNEGARIVSASDDCTVQVWNDEGGWRCSARVEHDNLAQCVAMSMNGERLVSGDQGGTVRVWESKDGEWEGTSIKGHSDTVEQVTMTSNKIVSWCNRDATLRIANKDVPDWKTREVHGHSLDVRSVAGSRDGRGVVSGGYDGIVLLWEVVESVCNRTVLGEHTSVVECVAIRHHGLWVASASRDETLRVWRSEAEKWVEDILEGHSGWVNSVAICEEMERVVSGGDDGTVRVWKLCNGQWRGESLTRHRRSVSCVSISRDGQRLASGIYDGTVRVSQWNGGAWVATVICEHTSFVKCVAMSGGRVVSGSRDRTMRVWNLRDSEWRATVLNRSGDWVQEVFLSNDGRRIRARNSEWNVLCYAEEHGHWERQTTGDGSSKDFWWLVEDDWPHDLCWIFQELSAVWKAADGVHFERLRDEPYFAYLQLRN